MKKIAFLVIILLIPSFLLGCGMIGISTNIPLFTSGTVVELVNPGPHYQSVTVNGAAQEFKNSEGRVSKFIAPGGSAAIRLANWSSGYSATAVITVKAWDFPPADDNCGRKHQPEFVGAVSRRYSVGSYQNAYSWLVTEEEIRSGRANFFGWGW